MNMEGKEGYYFVNELFNEEIMFKLIDKETWKRKPYFDHYFNQIRCTYSITVNIDISEVISFKTRNHTKLYPLLIYVLTKAVNNHEEFRTAINNRGELGVWDTLLPCYTVFHKENETFSNLWTEWDDNLKTFLSNYEQDMEMFGGNYGIDAKPDTPANTFPVSSLPWATFTGFNLNIFADGSYLLPIFTYGKYLGGKETLTVLQNQSPENEFDKAISFLVDTIATDDFNMNYEVSGRDNDALSKIVTMENDEYLALFEPYIKLIKSKEPRDTIHDLLERKDVLQSSIMFREYSSSINNEKQGSHKNIAI